MAIISDINVFHSFSLFSFSPSLPFCERNKKNSVYLFHCTTVRSTHGVMLNMDYLHPVTKSLINVCCFKTEQITTTAAIDVHLPRDINKNNASMNCDMNFHIKICHTNTKCVLMFNVLSISFPLRSSKCSDFIVRSVVVDVYQF